MMHQSARKLWKQALWMTKIKLVYTRITLTRFTTLYFFLALLNCVVLVILQGVTYADNAAAVSTLQGLLVDSPVNKRLPVYSDGVLKMCDNIRHASACAVVATSKPDDSIAAREINKIATRVGRRVDFNARQAVPLPPKEDDDSDSDSESGDESDDESDDEGGEESDDEGDEEGDDEDEDAEQLTILPVNATASENGGADPSPTGKIGRPLNGDSGNGNSDTSSPESASAKENTVDLECAYVLRWLDDIFDDAKREDLVTLVFHLWTFSLAFVTVLNESLPHLGAALAGHILGTSWAGYRLSFTGKLREQYMGLISAGACNGVDMLGDWWEVKKLHAIPVVVVSSLVLLTTGILSINLYKVYSSQSFSRVGTSPQIHRIYKLVLFLSVNLQLTGFFSIASTAIWIDKISHGAIRTMADHLSYYLAAFAVILLMALPWCYLGWICVRRECRVRFWIFVALSVIILVILSLMFASPLYRFIFTCWPFFAAITVTSYILMVATILLALWCRLNFGKGLAHFLQVTEALEGVDFTPVYFTKQEKSDVEFAVPFDGGYQSPNAPLEKPEESYRTRAARGQSVYTEANGVPVMLSSTPSLFKESRRGRQSMNSDAGSRSDRDSYPVPQMPPRSAASSIRQGLPSGPRSKLPNL